MNDGGPAFPLDDTACAIAQNCEPTVERGMSLRDWFAGQCLRGYIGSLESPVPYGGCVIPAKELVAQVCYEYADAMIAARHTKP